MDTDLDLINKFSSGDERSFELLYKKYFAALCFFAHSKCGDPEISREVVQEVFLSLWKNRKKVSIRESVKSYLYRAVTNRIINHHKHWKIELAYRQKLESNPSVPNQAGQMELEEKLFSLIEELPPKRKEVFMLSRFEGLKYKEIANQLNISLKTVEGQMSQALRFLEENLSDYLPILIISFWQQWG